LHVVSSAEFTETPTLMKSKTGPKVHVGS